ncbi:hypothetical protein M569_12090, partial [Genlisea aurea]
FEMIPAELEEWVKEAISKLHSLKLLRSLRPIQLTSANCDAFQSSLSPRREDLIFDGPRKWDRDSVQVNVSESTFQKWLHDSPSSGSISLNIRSTDSSDAKLRKLTNFSGNDYMALSSHPAVCRAAIEATQEHGMGPRGSALICGYTSYHRLLESSLAELKRKEECILCPTGFSANMAVMTAVGSIVSLLSGRKPAESEKVAVFSDSLNHASIIDGIRLAERQGNVVTFVYRHCDMSHLDALLSRCLMKKKMVITDSLFSMDGDFAPLSELVELRKKHHFLFVIDDAHATFVCGKNGGGAAEMFDCESEVDLCIGTLSKAAGCIGGFIACRYHLSVLQPTMTTIFNT